MNEILESYLVGLVLGAGFSGLFATLFTLQSNVAHVLKESLGSDE